MSPVPKASAQLIPTAGSYRLERRLGRGATGEVWLGRHQLEGSVAAIKLLRPRARADGDTIAVLEREFRVIARLDHPHIVSVVEIGEQHVALQYIEGTTLARRLTKPMPFSLIQKIALQIASALAHAHGRGVVHRDVKPSNVLLDRNENAFLADFGIASSDDDARAVELGVGTRNFMPPEQSAGGAITPASDQYALGRTIIAMLLADSVPPADDIAIERIANDWSAEIAETVGRIVAPEPSERFESIVELEVAVRALTSPRLEPSRTLAREQRPRAPFEWMTGAEQIREHAPSLVESRLHIAALRDAGLLPRDACDALLARGGQTDIGFSVFGNTERLGPIDDPGMAARAIEVVFLMHGWGCARESFRSIALALCRDCTELIVITPDVLGFGESPIPEERVSPEVLSPANLYGTMLDLSTLLGLRDVPTVMLGHSAMGLAVLVGNEDGRSVSPSRIALNAPAPFVAPPVRRLMLLSAFLLRVIRRWPRFYRWTMRVANRLDELNQLDPEHRAFSIALIEAVPLGLAAAFLTGLARAVPGVIDHGARTMLVHSSADRHTPKHVIDRTADALVIPRDRIRTLESPSHLPHIPNSKRPEDSKRCTALIIHAVEDMLIAARNAPIVAETTITSHGGAAGFRRA